MKYNIMKEKINKLREDNKSLKSSLISLEYKQQLVNVMSSDELEFGKIAVSKVHSPKGGERGGGNFSKMNSPKDNYYDREVMMMDQSKMGVVR